MEDFFAEAPAEPIPARARLGRWLFYDTRLSRDATIACATCHRPAHAFSEPLPVSIGTGGARGRRKAPTLLNLAARTVLPDSTESDRGERYFWDGRVTALESQVLVPIASPTEMGLEHGLLLERVGSIRGYRRYFNEAFGSTAVTLERVAAALADYVRTLKSGNAAYDRWRYGSDPRSMSVRAQRGSDIFFFTGRCALCHAGFNFSDGRFHNLGIGWDAASRTFADEGRALVTGVDRDRGAFKTPALRDVSKHAPYMHDGSLATLRDVVEFYNRGGNPNPWRSGRLAPLGLGPVQIDELVAFLESLDSDGDADRPPRLFPQ
jgi:cytochrome c peroxidase